MSLKINTKVNILNFGEQMPDGSYRFRGYQLDELLLDIQKEAAEKAWLAADFAWLEQEFARTKEDYNKDIEEHKADFEKYWQNLEKQKE